jgi:hypothetical protein
MASRVSQRLAEGSGAVFYPVAEIIAALNEAQRFFVLLTLALEKTSAWAVPTFAANGNAPFFHMLQYFTDWIAPLRIATASGAKVRPASLADLDALDSQWRNSPGAPQRYASMGADFLALYQQPASAGTTLQLTYARGPVTLVANADVPEIPQNHHPLLVGYAVYRLRQVEGSQEFQKSLPYLNDFLDGAQVYGNYVRERSAGNRYDSEPFELAKFDRSKMFKM